MKRPLVFGMLFLILGIWMGQFALHWNGVVHVAFFCVLVCVCGGFAWRYRWGQTFLFLIFFSVGFARAAQISTPVDQWVEDVVGYSVEVEGVVLDVSETKNGYLRTVIQVSAVETKEGRLETRMKIQATMRGEQDVGVAQTVRIRGQLEKPSAKKNPGGFDEVQYLKSQQIEYKMFASVVQKGEISDGFLLRFYQLKNKILRVYDQALPEREALIMKSMILGDTSGLDEDIKELYQVSGIYHILAISGQHITVLALVLNVLLMRFFGRRVSGFLVMGFLIAYAVITGCAVSTVRAVVMFGVFMVGNMLDRDTDLLSSTAFAAICLLIYEPLNLYNMGFQFSFVAVFSIAIGTEPLKRFCVFVSYRSVVLGRVFNNRYMLEYFPPSAAAFLGTMPITVYHFMYVTPYGLFVNLLIIATTSFLIVAGFFVGLIGLISTSVAVFACGSVYYLLRAYDWICTFFVALPYSKFLMGTPSLAVILLWYGFYACFIYLFVSLGDEFKKRRRIFCLYAILLVGIHFGSMLLPKSVEMTVLDMGEADCFVVIKGKRCFVIDSGVYGKNKYERQVLTRFLEAKGISKVDAAIIRADPNREVVDYAVFDLVKKKAVDALYLEDVVASGESKEMADLYQLVDRYRSKFGIGVDLLAIGDILEWNQIVFEYLDLDNQRVVRQYVKDGAIDYFFDVVKWGQSAVIFSGERNGNRKDTEGIRVFHTAKQGAVRLKATGRGVTIYTGSR